HEKIEPPPVMVHRAFAAEFAEEFRALAGAVSRIGVEVLSRRGHCAVPDLGGEQAVGRRAGRLTVVKVGLRRGAARQAPGPAPRPTTAPARGSAAPAPLGRSATTA